ncbi:serine/threonine kinase [Fragilaria crotonensis]|nr:serine/threonine kinase [Fragilaria crotonensis]
MPTNGTVFAMPDIPGYLGLTPFRNRDDKYLKYLERLQLMQLINGLDLTGELPDYTAEFLIDSILALLTAHSSVPAISRRNGTLVTSKLRNLTFQGVSGNVSFTPEGDRLDPLYTIFNMQIINGSRQWVDVGPAGATWATPNRTKTCFAVTGCNLKEIPSDQYPVPAKAVEIWVIAVIATMLVVLFAVGAFGDVYLAEDSRLTKKFAVKMISPTLCDQDTIEEMRRSFRRELSCVVYEYAANGSLADFFTDDGNRARLSSDVRLSVMFQLVRAVHFLHTGGCKVAGKGWNVFHRDIKSANVWLADDFTPRLIDCGLAIFVQDDNSSVTPESFPVTLQSITGGCAHGTPGYICPEYFGKKLRGLPCPYIAAYDVYSIGVVLVELILGRLTYSNDSQFFDVFEKYVQEERRYHRIVDGWKKLMGDADPTVMWNPDALEIA